jgi:hypothetical protein
MSQWNVNLSDIYLFLQIYYAEKQSSYLGDIKMKSILEVFRLRYDHEVETPTATEIGNDDRVHRHRLQDLFPRHLERLQISVKWHLIHSPNETLRSRVCQELQSRKVWQSVWARCSALSLFSTVTTHSPSKPSRHYDSSQTLVHREVVRANFSPLLCKVIINIHFVNGIWVENT